MVDGIAPENAFVPKSNTCKLDSWDNCSGIFPVNQFEFRFRFQRLEQEEIAGVNLPDILLEARFIISKFVRFWTSEDRVPLIKLKLRSRILSFLSFHNCDGIGPENSLSARSRTSRFDKDPSNEGSCPCRPRWGRERATTVAFMQAIPVHEQGDDSVPQSAIPSVLVRPDLNAISLSNSEASAYGPEEHNNMTKNNLNLEQLEQVIWKLK